MTAPGTKAQRVLVHVHDPSIAFTSSGQMNCQRASERGQRKHTNEHESREGAQRTIEG